MLLGHREATDDVAKVLLRVSEDYEGGDLGIDRDVVVGHALRLVDSAVVTLLERDRTTFHDVDQVFLQRLKSNLQSGPHITTWDAEELVRLWQELSDTQKDCTWTTSVLQSVMPFFSSQAKLMVDQLSLSTPHCHIERVLCVRRGCLPSTSTLSNPNILHFPH